MPAGGTVQAISPLPIAALRLTGTVSVRRALAVKVGASGAKKIVDEISPKYKDRKGGYTRITKLPARLSDNSLQAIIEFV